MLKRLLSTLAALAFTASAATAQVGAGASTPGGAPISTASGGPPTLSGCGTTPSFLGAANSSYGRIQTGGGATTGCVLTWTNSAGVATPRLAIPACVVTAEQAASTLTTAVPTVNGLTLTYTSTTAGVFDYQCEGV